MADQIRILDRLIQARPFDLRALLRLATWACVAAVALMLAVLSGCWLARPEAQELALPLTNDSVRFGVIGDGGTGEAPQYEVGRQLAAGAGVGRRRRGARGDEAPGGA